MALDDTTREKVLFVGGKLTGVTCPDCDFESRDVKINAHTITDISCPACGATILSEDEKSDLRSAHKL